MFQRPYVWRRVEQWQPLWEDIQAVLERQLDDTPLNDALPHFLGAVYGVHKRWRDPNKD